MPLETPALPMNNARTEQVMARTDTILNDDRLRDATFRRFERQIAPYPESNGDFDLTSEESLDDSLWNREEFETPVQAIERIEQAKWPVTHEQKVEQSLQYLTDQQLLAYAVANTKAVWALKHVI